MDKQTLVKYGAIALAAVVLVVMARRARGWLVPLGSRADFPRLGADNKVHNLVYRDRKTNKVYFRWVVQRPQYFYAAMLLSGNAYQNIIKSVDVIVRGIGAKSGKPIVAGLKNIRPQVARGSPWREYTVLRAQLINAPMGDAVNDFDYVAFDAELNFPETESAPAQRRFLWDMVVNTLHFGGMDMVERVAEDTMFDESVYKIVPRS